jgi:hypothetical protein
MYAELERKVCPKCKTEREFDSFGKDSTTAKGISAWCKPCKKSWRSEHRKKYPEKAKARDRSSDLQKNYGISIKEYDEMLRIQDGRCGCCGIHQSRFVRRLHVDHDHATGKIRGLLCTQCNPGIGYFQHSIERLKLGVAYLEKFKN